MLSSYFSMNFMTLMILIALVSMMYVNRDAKIPAASLFTVCIGIMFALTFVETYNVGTDVSALAPDQAARIISLHLWCSTASYVLRPFIILTEILIILRDKKWRFFISIPALINTVVFSTALFGSRIAFYVDEQNSWHSGPLRLVAYFTLIFYILALLYCTVSAFRMHEAGKSMILNVILVQATLAAILEYNNKSYTDPITALCLLEYYIYLTTVYRQDLTQKLDDYVGELEVAGVRFKKLTAEVMEALASAIDAKDTYTNGHSRRVAEYSKRIAEDIGKSAEECENIYFAALLHDVGKIGVPIEILTKKGRLSDEEFDQIKQHPVVGGQILSSISDSPWLTIGARYHHERYNGKGYPEGLKGEEIPEIARIIAVADAYDAMTSNRSYRDAIPQHIVREELVKGTGIQFDPEFAKIMIHIIDLDIEYRLKESVSGANVSTSDGLRCETLYNGCMDGIGITPKKTTIHLSSRPDYGVMPEDSLPTIIVFDALDGNVHPGEEDNKDLLYFEYALIRMDGKIEEKNIRKSEIRFNENETALDKPGVRDTEYGNRYKIEAVRNRDHVFIRVSNARNMFEVAIALPDTSRYVFLSLSGEKCELHNIKVDTDDEITPADTLPRIAEEISYIKGCPVGDIPNLEVDGPRLSSTDGIPVLDGMTVTFHTMSYPTARLSWHCPYIYLFSSNDGRVDGEDFHEYQLIKLDGESWDSDDYADNIVDLKQTEAFEGWNYWKDKNKEGLDVSVKIWTEEGNIMVETENLGISIHNVTKPRDGAQNVYVAITGDQCAITDIHVIR